MGIVSSIIVEDRPAVGTRRSIVERHTDNLGVTYEFRYLTPDVAWDAVAAMTARAITLWASILANETSENLRAIVTSGSVAVLKTNYSSAAIHIGALRALYLSATALQAIFIADFLSSLTDAQLQTAFGISVAQVTTLRTNKLTPAAATAAAIRAAVGQ
jgi:hypothetical protein